MHIYEPKPKAKPTCRSLLAKSAHMNVLMTVHNCSTQYSNVLFCRAYETLA